jgi:uncharacterized protein
MDCRPGCGACCIAPSIAQPFYGMPQGKPAGVRCIHLDDSLACRLFGDPRRPALCAAFQAEAAVCGDDRQQALQRLSVLEIESSPAEATK